MRIETPNVSFSRLWDRLFFKMGIPIPGKTALSVWQNYGAVTLKWFKQQSRFRYILEKFLEFRQTFRWPYKSWSVSTNYQIFICLIAIIPPQISWIKSMCCEQNIDFNLKSNPRGKCAILCSSGLLYHDDVIKWKHFPCYWPFVREIHRFPVNSPHKGQWRGAFMFSLICVWIIGWVNNREAGDLRRYDNHYDVIVMCILSTAFPDSKVHGANMRRTWGR